MEIVIHLHVPGTVAGTRDTPVGKTEKAAPLLELTFQWGDNEQERGPTERQHEVAVSSKEVMKPRGVLQVTH